MKSCRRILLSSCLFTTLIGYSSFSGSSEKASLCNLTLSGMIQTEKTQSTNEEYRNRVSANQNKFIMNRNLTGWRRPQWENSEYVPGYFDLLQNEFTQDLSAVKKGEWWLDGGAGDLDAQLELTAHFRFQGNIIAVTPTESEYTRNAVGKLLSKAKSNSKGTQFKYYHNYIEDLDPVALPKASLISDVQGAFAYSRRPDLVLMKYAQLLKPGGKAYLYLPGLPNLKISEEDSPFSTMMDWFKSIEGLHFKGIQNSDYGQVAIFERAAEPIRFHPLTVLSYNDFNSPPIRSFQFNSQQKVELQDQLSDEGYFRKLLNGFFGK